MNTYTIAMIGLAIVVTAIITSVLQRHRCNSKMEHIVSNNTEETELNKSCDDRAIDVPATVNLRDVNELLLENVLGENIVFKRPDITDDKEYREIVLDRNGMIVQHTGQALVTANQTTYTLSQLNKIAPNGLFTGSVPISDISIYKDGLASSVKYSSKGVLTHNGFVPLDSSQIAHVSPMAITAVTMQGAAIISGQYYLVQIKRELEGFQKKIEELKDLHEKEACGRLLNCRARLLEILNKQYCDSSDIQEIRGIAKTAGDILNQYWLRYNDALKIMEDYYFDGVRSDRAIAEFNNRVKHVSYLRQICLIADRTVMEAKYVEYVTRSKMDASDLALFDLSREIENLYCNSFTSQVKAEEEDEFDHIYKKASKILEQGYSGLWLWKSSGEQERLMIPIDETMKEMKKDYEVIALDNYKNRVNQQKKDVLLMIDEKTGEIKMFEAA